MSMRPLSLIPALLLLSVAGCQRPVRAADAASLSCALPAAAQPASLAATPVENPAAVFDTAWTIIRRTHWDTTYNGVNWEALRTELRPKAEAATTTGELRSILTDMVGRLRQSHFAIIPREISDATPAGGAAESGAVAIDRTGVTGVTLRYVDKALLVTNVRAGSSAKRAGVQPGYVLESVEGCPIAPRLARIPASLGERGIALTAYSLGTRALNGAVGDSVAVRFRDGRNQPLDVYLVREREAGTMVKFGNLPANVARLEWERRQVNGRTIGVIRWNIWMPVLAAQFDAAIDSLRGSDAILLDIRGNPGGVGGMAMGISGHFVDTVRVIGVMKQRGTNDLRFVANPRQVNARGERVQPFTGPVALVVDEISISTSEIFAEGMQAIGRARVFGTQTAGQALPSVAERLPNGDILYHAIANFLSPTGRPIEGDGVIPDVRAPLSRQLLLDGKDPALDAAIAWAASQPRRAM
jgi:carboxyl-terminal processing protease